MAQHAFQSFSDGGKNHSWVSGIYARSRRGLADLSQNVCRGVTRQHRSGNHAAASGFDLFAADDFVPCPVPTLHQHIGEQAGDDFAWRQIIENDDPVHTLQRGKKLGAFLLWQNGASRAFQLVHAGIAIQADDERIAKVTRLLEATNMARMQYVEAAVGEHNAASVAFLAAKPQNRFIQSENRRTIQGISMQAQRQRR